MRLIDADALIDDLEKIGRNLFNDIPLFRIIHNAPTIEAEPVRHGKYVLLYDTYGPMVCSECGGEAPSISMGSEYEESQYCPSCGAKMDGAEREGAETLPYCGGGLE